MCVRACVRACVCVRASVRVCVLLMTMTSFQQYVLFSVMILVTKMVGVVVAAMVVMALGQRCAVLSDDVDYDDNGYGSDDDDDADDDDDFRPTAVLFTVTDAKGAFVDKPKLGSPFTINFNVEPTSSALSSSQKRVQALSLTHTHTHTHTHTRTYTRTHAHS